MCWMSELKESRWRSTMESKSRTGRGGDMGSGVRRSCRSIWSKCVVGFWGERGFGLRWAEEEQVTGEGASGGSSGEGSARKEQMK